MLKICFVLLTLLWIWTIAAMFYLEVPLEFTVAVFLSIGVIWIAIAFKLVSTIEVYER